MTWLAAVLCTALVLSACTGKNSGDNKPPNNAQETRASQETGGSNHEETSAVNNLDFPDTFPIPSPVDAGSYAYDDLKTKYDIEIMLSGAINQSIPDDPIKDYLDKKYNVNVKLTNLSGDDLRNTVAVRFASGDAPDVVFLPFKDIAISLFNQGQLAEVSDILPLMPQLTQYVTKDYKKWATIDGNMIGIPRYSTFQDNWGLFIRADWLDILGLDMPTNEDELFEYATAVVNGDPNQNGTADTWFMGTAGGGNNWSMMEPLRAMYGHPGWNISDNNTINHPMLDGTTKSFLQFLKKLNDNNLLSPDWYTIAWEPFKSYTFNDQIGMVNYPGWNLIDETYNAQGRDMSVLDKWEPIEPLKSNDGRGGYYAPGGNPAGLFVFSKKAAENEDKIKRIAHIIDTMIYPNENYWAVSQGGGPEVFPGKSEVIFNENDGTNIFTFDKESHPAYIDPAYSALGDWQWVGYTLLWQVYDDPIGEIGSKHNMFVNNLPRYPNYSLFLSLDGPTESKIVDFVKRNEIRFVLGDRSFDEWDQYVQEWKDAGGQKLMEQAADQLNVSL